jgi:choline dehydrogenase-like flavoprotein
MDRQKQREIASKGGKAAHAKGTAHEWTSEEAREAGRKGGMASHRRRKEMSDGTDDSAQGSGSADMSGTNPDGETWEAANLVVADASCFPTASGVNPMISIESIAYMNAKRLAARLS